MRMLVASDSHFGRKDALVREFVQTLLAVGPLADIIVISGDFVDNDLPATRELVLHFLETAKNYHFFDKLFFVYGGMIHEVKLLHSIPGLLMNDYCLLSSAIGRLIIIHGNNIGLYYDPQKGETAKFGAERAKRNLLANPVSWLPRIFEDDYLLFGHLHRRFYHELAKMYCTSCWVPTVDPQNNMGFVLLIDDHKTDPFIALRFNELGGKI